MWLSWMLLKSSEPSREIVLRFVLATPLVTILGCAFVGLVPFSLTCAPGSGGTAGTDDRRRCSFRLGRAPGTLCVLSASPSDALLALTVPASLRWNQLMMGLLDLREIFFICD